MKLLRYFFNYKKSISLHALRDVSGSTSEKSNSPAFVTFEGEAKKSAVLPSLSTFLGGLNDV